MKRKWFFFLIVWLMWAVPFANAQEEVILATTTSVQDTGLLDVIVPMFEKKYNYRLKAVAVGTGQALALAGRGEADVILAHAPDAEKKYVDDGLLVNRRVVMHNSFLLAGPPADPAQVSKTTAAEALQKIAVAKATFVSRGDDSGTHKLEKKLWTSAGIKPTGKWYLESGQGMGRTLSIAGEKRGYVLTDRATYLAFQKTIDLTVVVEDDPAFLNIYSVSLVNPEKFSKVQAAGGMAFANFLLSAEVQDLLKTFGVEKFGEPLFHPDAGRMAEDVMNAER